MEERNIRLCKMKNKNMKKQCSTKKHKHFSSLIINKNIIRNPEIAKFEDIIHPYYNIQKKKIENFSKCVMWMKMICL